MIREFNLIIIFIFMVYFINSYYLSVKRNIIKISSFLLRIIISLLLSKLLVSSILKISISNDSYEYMMNGEVIYNVNDIIRVLLIKNYPELKFIINERITSKYIIDSISTLLMRTVLIVLIYIFITIIYKITMNIIKIYRKKKQKQVEVMSKKRGLIYGALQGFIIVFLISVPFSGISSITNDYLRIEEEIQISKPISFFKDYRLTLPGSIFGEININEKPIDTFLFDKTFSLEINNYTILPSEEVKVYVDIYRLLDIDYGDELKLNSFNHLDEEAVNKLISRLNSAKSLNITVPLLIDYFLYNEYKILVDDELYDVDYYNDITKLGELLILIINEYDNLDINNYRKLDKFVMYDGLDIVSELDLLDKLSFDISNEILTNKEILEILKVYDLEIINLDNVNYKKELIILREIFERVFEISKEFDEDTIIELTKLVASSNLIMDNQSHLLDFAIKRMFSEYDSEIRRYDLNEDDINSLITILKAYIDNGYLESYFRFSKLYDDKTYEILVDAICSSNLLRKNLEVIIKLLLKQSQFNFDFPFKVPDDLDFSTTEGERELRELFRLFNIMNHGITQENIENNLDEICRIVENSYLIRSNINNIIHWGIDKYNTSIYNIYVKEIDFNSEEGDEELENLLKILRLIVNKKVLDGDLSTILSFSKEEIDIVFNSKIIEEAMMHFLYDLGRDNNNPLVVNLELGDEAWYKNNKNSGELRQFVYAIKIIFKDVKSINDIEFTSDLILSIDDGTIDTNGDGVVDYRDENELLEIMKSKILSDTIIKFIYDYFKENNK